jgi:excinuclease ABC subunit A
VHKARYEGIIPNLERRHSEAESASDAYFKRIAKFATEQICRSCDGHRLQKSFLHVKISGKNIGELASMSVEQSIVFFSELVLTKSEEHIAKPILKNIVERLEFLSGV